MKLLKRIAVLSLCVLAVSGCTKSSISTQAPVIGTEMPQDKQDSFEEEVVERAELVEEDAVEESRFDWEQAAEEVQDLFGDTDFYPESVEAGFEVSESEMAIKLVWILQDGTDEETVNAYAAEMVQKFNDVLAVQVVDVEFSSQESFGGIWDEFALEVKVGTEDGTWTVDKSYAAGEEIDLELPEYGNSGPSVNQETVEKVSPNQGKEPAEKIYPGMNSTKEDDVKTAPGK